MRHRVLLAITVYNGREVVLRCLQSAPLLSRHRADVDILVLDDCSPAPGWSDELRAVCGEMGFQYYRSPRNLGIVRNVNLGLLRATTAGYDAVIISNSDVIYPRSLVDRFTEIADSDPSIGSITAWSNNVSLYSLPNDDADAHLASQAVVDEISGALAAGFGDRAVDIPAGISFCIYIPTGAVRRVGLMDPVFGRGYCEETDWSLRSLALGYRLVLAPGVFVHHAGRVSTSSAGMLAAGHTTVPANEAIIDMRYPEFRTNVRDFVETGVLAELHDAALRRIVREGAEAHGFTVEITTLPRHQDAAAVRCVVSPAAGEVRFVAQYRGFRLAVPVASHELLADVIEEVMGRPPRGVRLDDRGAFGEALKVGLAARGAEVEDAVAYPRRV